MRLLMQAAAMACSKFMTSALFWAYRTHDTRLGTRYELVTWLQKMSLRSRPALRFVEQNTVDDIEPSRNFFGVSDDRHYVLEDLTDAP
jgi:hypothetical protein